jgi:hypothetical protein
MRPGLNASRNGADKQTAALRRMTVDQLRDLGTCKVAYLRASTCDGERLFVLYYSATIRMSGARQLG